MTTPLKEQGVEVLAVLPNRKKETVVKFLASIPVRLRNTIARVCTDMYLGFVNAAREQLPRAHIIIDHFHVAQAYRNCADKVRRQELKLLKKQLWICPALLLDHSSRSIAHDYTTEMLQAGVVEFKGQAA